MYAQRSAEDVKYGLEPAAFHVRDLRALESIVARTHASLVSEGRDCAKVGLTDGMVESKHGPCYTASVRVTQAGSYWLEVFVTKHSSAVVTEPCDCPRR